MKPDLDWEERGRVCRAQLDFARFLVGEWQGRGHSRGEPVRARLLVRDRFAGTFLHCEESLWGPDGALSHEDAAFFRYDPDAELVRVTHYMANGWVSEQLLRPTAQAPGCFWYGGPMAPRVDLRPEGEDGLRVEVWLPEDAAPDTVILYRRQGAP